MLALADKEGEKDNIKQKQLHGLELQPYMFTIATTNMILRGDGKSNLLNKNFLTEKANKLQLKGATVGMMNPPYSQGSAKNPTLYEIAFTEHLLNSLTDSSKAIVIIPQSSLTGKSIEEKNVKKNILKYHTLEGVITLNKDTFYGVGTMPCVAIFTTGKPHPNNKLCKFIDFREDGYKVSPHIGLIETTQAKDKKQHLLDVWFNRMEAEVKFCVKTPIEADDEWLHSFYYFNDEIPTEKEFERTIGDYLSFEFSMIMQDRGYLFAFPNDKRKLQMTTSLLDQEWRAFFIGGDDGVFIIKSTSTGIDKNKLLKSEDKVTIPYITRSNICNGINQFIPETQKEKYNLDEANVITIGLDTQTIFFQPHTFYTGQNIQVLRHEKLNKYNAQFLIPLLKIQMKKFNWGGNGATLGRLLKTKIILPIDKDNNPNWLFMEEYTKAIFEIKRKKYIQYANTFSNLNLSQE